MTTPEDPAAPAPPALVDQLARADVKARLFGTPAESARVGRFAVLRRIGAGGMGVVYAAYDEQLDRKVAIKLVRPGRDDPATRARSRLEAQALARLSHPNVVQVYEVGEYLGQVYLAMEYVHGQTLRAWQAAAPRTWRAVVAMYLQVGHGLAAAHARGLVHRDFKPDNVLVGADDQRPRVLDFGLARVRAREPGPGPGPAPFTPPEPTSDHARFDLSREPASHDLSQQPDPPAATVTPDHDLSRPPAPDTPRLTVPGAVLGTPAYMAPEQLAGDEADARSDVFSFCVAVHEALLRVRPFPGDRSDALRAAVQRGTRVRPEHPTDAPAWLLRVVERGLAADPADRWPAMDPLLAALTRDPTRRRRRLALALALTAVTAVGSLGLLELRDRRQAAALASEQARTADAEAALGQAHAAADVEAQRSLARRLALDASQAADADPDLHLLLAVEAVRVHSDAGAAPLAEAEQTLRDALGNVTHTPFLRADAPPSFVDAVAESPDGQWLATGERTGAVTLWSTTAPHQPIPLLPGDGPPVRALEFSRTQLAAIRDEPGVHVWTLAPVQKDIQHVRRDSPLADLRDLQWSPDGASLLTRSSTDAAILRADAPPTALHGHTAPIRRAVWSPDSKSILTASADHTARLWPARGGPPRTVRISDAPLWSAAFSRDGREFALASADHTAARIPVRGGPPRRLRGHTGPVLAVGFTADDALVTVSADATARIWDLEGSSTRVDLPGHRDVLGGVRIADGGDLLLATPTGGAAWLWQLSRPGPPLVLHGHRGNVVAARFGAAGRHVLTGSSDGTTRRWHVDDDPAVLRGHDAGIETATFAPDAQRVVTASMDGSVRVWPRDGRSATVLRGHREGSSVLAAFDPSGTRLATAGSDGLARLWSLATPVPTLLATLPAESDRDAVLTALEWHTDHLAIAGDDGRVHLVDTITKPVRTDILTISKSPLTTLAFSPDGASLATAGDDATIRIHTLSPTPVLSTTLTGHDAPIRDLVFTTTHLVSVGDDATVRQWTTPPTVLRGHLRAISQIRVHPDGHTLLTASTDGTARVWPAHGDPEVLTGHTDAVWLAAWSPDGATILTASADGTARLWQRHDTTWQPTSLPQTGAPGEADNTLWTGGFSPDGRLAVVAGADAIARIFPVQLADLRTTACARVAKNLDPATWLRHLGDRRQRPTCPLTPG